MKVLKRTLAFVFVLALMISGITAISAASTHFEKDYRFADTTTTNGSERPSTAKVFTHEYYVGEIKSPDSEADLGSEENPFPTLQRAINAFVNGKDGNTSFEQYLSGLTYEDAKTRIDEVKLILVGDTHETGLASMIKGGVLTITAKENVHATIYIGDKDKIVSTSNGGLVYLGSNSNSDELYGEVNLGTPDMKANNSSLTIDGTGFAPTAGNGSGVICMGHYNWGKQSVLLANMYDGVTIKNIGYDEEAGEQIEARGGNVIHVSRGTFKMYGGTITQNICNAIICNMNMDLTGSGSFIYGGEFTKNNASVFVTSNSNDWGGTITIYDCLVQQNHANKNEGGIVRASCGNGAVIIYGGKFINNYCDYSNNVFYSDRPFYIADGETGNVTIENEPFKDFLGNDCTVTKTFQHPNYTSIIASKIFYAEDGSATAYGYALNNDGEVSLYVHDNKVSSSFDDFKLENDKLTLVSGEQLYIKEGNLYKKVEDIDAALTISAANITGIKETATYYIHTVGEADKIVYPDGFDKEGYSVYACKDCKKDFIIENALDPIFKAIGYSVALDGSEIWGGYTINYEALNAYETVNKTTLSYGVIFANVNDKDVNNIDFENGKIQLRSNLKAIQVEFVDREYLKNSNDEYVKFNYKVSGFKPELPEYADLKLVIAMYVFEGENISFVQSESSVYDEKTVTANGKDTLNVITLGALYRNSDFSDDYDAVFEKNKETE